MYDPVLTAAQVFGANPWLSNPTLNGPSGMMNLPAVYYATPQTAAIVASIVGGTVVAFDPFASTPGNPFIASDPMQYVKLPSGIEINAGLVAGFFTHGYQESQLEAMISSELYNTQAAGGIANVQLQPISLARFAPLPPVTVPLPQVGSFGTLIQGTNPPAYNMVTNNSPAALNFNGKQNTDAAVNIQSPDGGLYIAWVWPNGLLQSVTGRWTRIG